MMEMLENYLYEMRRFLPRKGREEILREIRSNIMEMTDNGMSIEEALAALGDPAEFAKEYNKSLGFLIGPELFDIYKYVVGFSILGVSIGLIVANVVAITFSAGEVSVFRSMLELLSQLVSVSLSIIGSVTVVFYIIQRTTKDRGKTSKAEWSPKELKKAPKPIQQVSGAGEVVGLVFLILALIVFNFYADRLGIYFREGNAAYQFIPIFNLERLKSYLVFFNLIWISGILLRLYLLTKRKQSIVTKSMDSVLTIGGIVMIWIMMSDQLLVDFGQMNTDWIKPTTLPLRFVMIGLIGLTIFDWVKFIMRYSSEE